MGTVYLAKNRMMDRPEVLKVISQAVLNKPGVRERFLQEIRAVANLDHPNIVAAYSVSRLGDSLTFAMAYVKGQNLEQVVNARGPLPVANAAFYIHQVALGLQHAHEKGKVHRDIKPNNLMLAIDGKKHVVKILDFGLAKAMSEKDADWAGDARGAEASRVGAELTRIGQILGTPDYVAPEQMLDAHAADTRADIYSLGCTLYFLLSGGPPFPEATLGEILEAHHKRDPKPLNLVRPEVPVELAAVVAKMMAKDPARRYQTPAEVAKALTPFFKPGQSIATPRPAAARSQPVAETERATASTTPAAPTEPPPVPFPLPVAPPLPVAVATSVPTADVLEEFSVSADAHRHPVRPRGGWSSLPPRQKAVVCLAICAAAALLMPGVGLVVRTPKGEIEIVLSDPKANVTVTVDGNRIDVAGLDEPLSLEVGEHNFKVTGKGYETITNTFTVTKGSNPQLTIKLKKKPPQPVPPDEVVSGAVDLLKRINPERDQVQGTWKLIGGALVAPATAWARLQIPYDVPDNYKLTVVVDHDPDASPNGLVIGLRVGERQACAAIDCYYGQVSGLSLVDGRDSDANSTTKRGRFLRDAQPNTIVCTVRNNEIRVSCNDVLITDWKDDVNRLSVHENYRMPNPRRLFISCHTAFRITKLELMALNGQHADAHDPQRDTNEKNVVKNDWALMFNGRDSTVTTPLKYDGKSPITIEAFVTPSEQFGKADIVSNTYGTGSALRIEPDRHWAFITHFDQDHLMARSDDEMVSGKRVHVAGVFDGKAMRLFIDGRPQQELPQTAELYSSDYPFAIGSAGALHACWFSGVIHAVRISKAVRYTGNFEPIFPFTADDATQLLYHFAEGDGLVAYDSSSNKNHAVIRNATWVKAGKLSGLEPEPSGKPASPVGNADVPEKSQTSARTPSKPAEISASGPVDLLKLIEADREAIPADCRLESGRLVMPDDHAARVEIPYELPADTARLSRMIGTSA
jgi:serine/threonine protein kinase